MADTPERGDNVLGLAFKKYPLFTVIVIVTFVYILWRETGGVERGENRRVAGETGIFVEVQTEEAAGARFFGVIEQRDQ